MEKVVKIFDMWFFLYSISLYIWAALMARRLTGDQNNISSKLLGANLADINIEKFRDLTTYKKNKYEL